MYKLQARILSSAISISKNNQPALVVQCAMPQKNNWSKLANHSAIPCKKSTINTVAVCSNGHGS